MTSEFDFLAICYEILFGSYKIRTPEKLYPFFDQLTSEAIKQINKREPDIWTYEKWMEKRGKLYKKLEYPELAIKFKFIDDTHDALDHTEKWHHHVFNRDFIELLYYLKRFFFKTGILEIRDIDVTFKYKLSIYILYR